MDVDLDKVWEKWYKNIPDEMVIIAANASREDLLRLAFKCGAVEGAYAESRKTKEADKVA